MQTSESTDKRNSLDGMTFEECYAELEKLVNRFEQGQMALGESIDHFERGMRLVERCSEMLVDAEKKVSELLQKVTPGIQESDGRSG